MREFIVTTFTKARMYLLLQFRDFHLAGGKKIIITDPKIPMFPGNGTSVAYAIALEGSSNSGVHRLFEGQGRKEKKRAHIARSHH